MVRLLITNPPRYRPFGLAQCAFVQPLANRRDYVTKLPPAVSVCDGCYGRIAFSIHHRWETCRHYAAQSRRRQRLMLMDINLDQLLWCEQRRFVWVNLRFRKG